MKVNQYKRNPGEEAGLCEHKAYDDKPQGSPMQRVTVRSSITLLWGGSEGALRNTVGCVVLAVPPLTGFGS